MTKFTTRILASCVPICRAELFEEVTSRLSSETVQDVWILPGHVFVTLNQGTKLLTFDCKPVAYQHHLGSSTLDFPVLQPAVLSILSSPSLPGVIFIVQENGHIHCWQFADTYQWSAIAEFDLYDPESSTATDVISVCLHPKHGSFFWCARRGSGDGSEEHVVCRQPLPESIEKLKNKGLRRPSVIMEQCLASDVIPLGSGVLVVPRHKPDHTRVCVLWKPSVLEMASVTAIVGTTIHELHDMRSPVGFPSVLVSCLSHLTQVLPSCADYGIQTDFITGDAVLMQTDGTIQIFQASNVLEEEETLRTQTVKISLSESLVQRKHGGDIWCVHRHLLALLTHHNTVRLYSLPSGQFLHEVEMDGSQTVTGFACVRSPTGMLSFITNAGVYIIQGGKMHITPRSQNDLPQGKQFQTDALQVALLSQEREENPCKDVTDKLLALHDKWQDLHARQPRSQLSDTVDTYLAEFWRLEEMANSFGRSQSPVGPPALDTQAMVQDAITRSRGMVADAGAAELLWLSRKYPVELLEALLGDLDIEKECLTPEDQVQWQAKLGLGSGEAHTVMPSAVTFELICRLLYQERPQSLVAFVRNAQHVSEQAVGVSAFVRRKHTLQYYVRAMQCLPEPSLSKDPQRAVTSKARIILLGESDDGHEVALRFLLQHGHWSEAISLLQSLSADSEHKRTPLFFLLLQQLVQNRILSDYAADVFALLPSWKSFVAAVKVISDGPSAQFDQMTASAPGLFFGGAPDIPLSAVRPQLMSLLNQDNSSS